MKMITTTNVYGCTYEVPAPNLTPLIHLLGIYTSFFHHFKRNKDYQSFLIFYAVKIVGGEISTDGFDTDEKEYASEARWVELSQLATMHHACSIDIADELLQLAKGIEH